MAIERRNPLPIASYWVDVPPAAVAAFDAWLGQNTSSLHVAITSAYPDGGQWVRFDVLSPVTWQGPGLPTIAKPEDTSPAATSTVPDVAEPPSLLEQGLSVVPWAAAALIALSLASLLRRR
jgi:hypothetical protein